jgi:hypothetical protein
MRSTPDDARRVRLLLLLLVGGLTLSAARTAASAPLAGALRSLRRELRAPLARGGTFTLELVRGRVRVEPAAGTEVQLLTLRTARRHPPDSVELRLERTAQGLRLWDRYPPLRSPPAECLRADERGDFWSSDVVTQVVVRLPPGVALYVRLLEGDIDVRGFHGPRDVATSTGQVLGLPLQVALGSTPPSGP